MRSMGAVTFLVRDYDEALTYFTHVLGFKLLEDKPLGEGKRWILVCPDSGAALLLARATREQDAHIGNQTGGRVAFFLHTDDFERDHEAMKARGANFIEEPRHETYGTVAVFLDLYWNKWDLVELRARRLPD